MMMSETGKGAGRGQRLLVRERNRGEPRVLARAKIIVARGKTLGERRETEEGGERREEAWLQMPCQDNLAFIHISDPPTPAELPVPFLLLKKKNKINN